MNQEIKKCKHCGAEPMLWKVDLNNKLEVFYLCTNMNCPSLHNYKTLEEIALEKWNNKN